jgi:hypothetical protein
MKKSYLKYIVTLSSSVLTCTAKISASSSLELTTNAKALVTKQASWFDLNILYSAYVVHTPVGMRPSLTGVYEAAFI